MTAAATPITEYLLNPADAVALSELRHKVDLYGTAKKYRAAVSAFEGAVNHGNELWDDIRSIVEDATTKLTATGLSHEDATRYFCANLLIESNAGAHKDYELMKIAAVHGDDVRKALETALTSKNPQLVAARKDYADIRTCLLQGDLKDIYEMEGFRDKLGAALQNIIAQSPLVGEEMAQKISVASLAHIAILDDRNIGLTQGNSRY